MSSQGRIQNLSYLLKALKQQPRTVALIIAVTLTAPLFIFTSLPPVEVLEQIPQEVEEEIEVPVLVNITEEVVVNRTVGVNITEGGSIFLEPQPAPPLIGSDIILCIDTSGSMAGQRLDLAKSAIYSLLDVLNKSNSAEISQDRVALVSFAQSGVDWTTDATIHTNADYVSNQTHLDDVINNVTALSTGGGTDIWAGLNLSLELLLNNPRDTPALKSIFLLTDGSHQSGPWNITVQGGNYSEFMTQPSNTGSASQSPIVVARANDVRIYSIGLFEGSSFGFDANFLTNISLNVTHGTYGDFFAGNDTLSLTEGFLQARDLASGWATTNSSSLLVNSSGNQTLFDFNVTSETRRLKWDLNWDNNTIDFDLNLLDPNDTLIEVIKNGTFSLTNPPNVIPISVTAPRSILIDFPMQGIWQFNLSWSNISTSERLKARLSTYSPPIFIDSVDQYNSTELGSALFFAYLKQAQGTQDPLLHSNLFSAEQETDSNFTATSVYFELNVTNKNPLFTYHNITPYMLTNLTEYNMTFSWEPPKLVNLTTSETVTFLFNITFYEPTLLQGQLYFKVNSSEGYYDAIAQDIVLDYRIITQNVTIESYIENRTITTIVISQGFTKVIKYTYNRQAFDTFKWMGFFVSLGILMSFLAVYVSARAYHLRNMAEKFRSRLFPDPSAIEAALQQEGISVAPEDLQNIIATTDDLDQFGHYIHNLTGVTLSPEDLIRITSGVSIDKIVERLSAITDSSKEELLAQLKDAPSIQALLSQLNLDKEKLLDIITQDEQVLSFQEKVSRLIRQPTSQQTSGIVLYDNLDVNKFKNRLKRVIKPEE